tara:strand:- start:313 stop:2184 length:1872 start_codon:yes stop_codon:yes gene_type:complete
MIKRKRYLTSIFPLTALAITSACNADTYTPNDLNEGKLPSNDSDILIQTMDGNWNQEIYLPAYPSNGHAVSFKAYATWSSRLVGNLMGFGSLEIHTNEKLDVIFDENLSAWRLKNESSPNTTGNNIPNNNKYVSYFVADGNWNSLLHLPIQKGKTSKILVRSQATYDTYIDSSMLVNMHENLKIKQGEYYVFTWSEAKAKWDIIEEKNPGGESEWANEDKYDKSFLVTSDPQLTCGENCNLSKDESKSRVYAQYKLFSENYSDVDALIINGDLTEFGHKREWKDFEDSIKNLNIPYYYGLGNHDITNNLNDCSQNHCVIRSFKKFHDHVNNKKNIKSYDALHASGYENGAIEETLEGSLSYSVDFGDVVLIQLNDFEPENNPIKIDQFSTAHGSKRYKIDRFQDPEYLWLENQLYDARKNNKIVVFNQHRRNADAGNLSNLLSKYNVKLRFSGHYHYNLGKSSNGFYESGSTATGTYLKLDINTRDKKARIYKSTGNNTVNLELIEEIYLDVSADDIEKPIPLSKVVKVKNEGGYLSYVWVDYLDADGNSVSKKSPKLSLGNTYMINIPGGSTNLRVRSESKTGLVWEPYRVIFDKNRSTSENFCAKTWGTTLKPKWGYVSCN